LRSRATPPVVVVVQLPPLRIAISLSVSVAAALILLQARRIIGPARFCEAENRDRDTAGHGRGA